MNIVMISGRMAGTPELKVTNNGKSTCEFSLAVKRDDGKTTEEGYPVSDWITVRAWNHSAEALAKYGEKGKILYVSGLLRTDNWTDAKGIKQRKTYVTALRVEFGSSRSKVNADGSRVSKTNEAEPEEFSSVTDEDIPF